MGAMDKYQRLLIELGENNYKTSGGHAAAQSTWPVEVRLLFMALVNAVTFIIIKMLATYLGEGMATTIVNALSSYLSGSPPQPGQTLFGGPTQPTAVTSGGPAPGGAPMPQVGGPLAGINVPEMLANFGSMFIRGQTPSAPAATTSAPITQPVANPRTPSTPRYTPAYLD